MSIGFWQLAIVLIFFSPTLIALILCLILIKKNEYKKLSKKHIYAGFWNRFLPGLIECILLSKNSNIRLCKGIYKESEDIAYQDYHNINKNYIKILKTAFKKGIYVGIATHDKVLIERCIKIIEEKNITKNKFEFQYLYGVPKNKTIDIYKEKGFKIRSYIPFGEDWYDYSIRRIKENPKIASYVIKNILSKT